MLACAFIVRCPSRIRATTRSSIGRHRRRCTVRRRGLRRDRSHRRSHRHTTTDAHGAFRSSRSPRRHVSPRGPTRQGYQPALSTPVIVDAGASSERRLRSQRATGDLHVIAVTGTVQELEPAAIQRVHADARRRSAASRRRAARGRCAAPASRRQQRHHRRYRRTRRRHQPQHPRHRNRGNRRRARRPPDRLRHQRRLQLSALAALPVSRRASALRIGRQRHLLGINAIGGVVNFQTLDPTPTTQVSVMQGYGTFERLATNVIASGTNGKLGYVVADGVSGLDGPFRNASFYQVGAQRKLRRRLVDNVARGSPQVDLRSGREDQPRVHRRQQLVLGKQDRKRRRRLSAVSDRLCVMRRVGERKSAAVRDTNDRLARRGSRVASLQLRLSRRGDLAPLRRRHGFADGFTTLYNDTTYRLKSADARTAIPQRLARSDQRLHTRRRLRRRQQRFHRRLQLLQQRVHLQRPLRTQPLKELVQRAILERGRLLHSRRLATATFAAHRFSQRVGKARERDRFLVPRSAALAALSRVAA